MNKETLLKKFLNGFYGKNQTDKFLSEVAFVNPTYFKLTVYYGEHMGDELGFIGYEHDGRIMNVTDHLPISSGYLEKTSVIAEFKYLQGYDNYEKALTAAKNVLAACYRQ